MLQSSVTSSGRETDLLRYGRSALFGVIDERLTGTRRSSVAVPAVTPADNRVEAGSRQVTEGVSCRSTGRILPERPRILYSYRGTYRMWLVSHTTLVKWPGSDRSCGKDHKRYVSQSRSACSGRRKVFVLPERGSGDCFPEQKAGRARRKSSTEGSSQTQKVRGTTACCWAVETPTTGAKTVKGLTRPCADLAELPKR